jgi:hypothetical protein
MLRGIDANPIIAGGYSDKRAGGICPMLAAHRNGGRTNLASFARAWDRFTGAQRPRLATDRELRALRSYIELSLLEGDGRSLAGIARQIRAERSRTRRDTGERHRGAELRRRRRWAWLIPTRRYDVFAERVAAAHEQSSEQRAAQLLKPRDRPAASSRAG